MKKIREIFVYLLMILALSNVVLLGAAEEEKPLNTAISNINWSKVDYLFLNENYTNFEFTIDYDIINPNEENVTLTFPTCGYSIFANMSAYFKDRKLEMYDYTSFCGLSVIYTECFSSGLTSKTVHYIIGIKKQGLTNLPDGTYYIWMECCNIDDSVVTANSTKLLIKEGNPIIIYDCNEPTIRLNLPFRYLILSKLFILFWNIFLKKK